MDENPFVPAIAILSQTIDNQSQIYGSVKPRSAKPLASRLADSRHMRKPR